MIWVRNYHRLYVEPANTKFDQRLIVVGGGPANSPHRWSRQFPLLIGGPATNVFKKKARSYWLLFVRYAKVYARLGKFISCEGCCTCWSAQKRRKCASCDTRAARRGRLVLTMQGRQTNTADFWWNVIDLEYPQFYILGTFMHALADACGPLYFTSKLHKHGNQKWQKKHEKWSPNWFYCPLRFWVSSRVD